jgi:uncharacterized RDD family membrane protein YckC
VSSTGQTAPYWPGKELGLPDAGPRSVARLGRRIVALVIDWAIASGVSLLISRPADLLDSNSWITLGVFAALQVIFIATLSGSIGHLVLGLRVVPLVPRWIGIGRPIVRTLLLCIVIPAVIWDRDQRALHDKIAGTVLVRR